MPAVTNANHVSLLTGVQPEVHGITGNAFWSRTAGDARRRLDDPALIAVQTLFTVTAEHDPPLATTAAFAKAKLARLFSAVPGRQRAPDRVWTPDTMPAGDVDDVTMTSALATMERPEPDLGVVCLPGVDRAGHRFGPDAPEYEHAIAAADAALGRLVDELHRLGRWGRSVLIVTADHGFAGVAPSADRPYPLITFGRDVLRAGIGGVHLVSDGRIEHVYADGIDAAATDATPAAATLARVAALASGTPGIAEVLARLPVSGVTSLGTAHPDWHVAHEHAGDLLLVAARGHHFSDPFDPEDAALLGDHGAADETAVPLFVTGGAPQIVAAPSGAPPPASVDVAATIATLLGLPLPKRVDGAPLPPGATGRVLAAVLAPPPGQSPH